jgi:hypothetical protein
MKDDSVDKYWTEHVKRTRWLYLKMYGGTLDHESLIGKEKPKLKAS